MKLEIGEVQIEDIKLGEQTKIEDGLLHVSRAELRKLLLEDKRLAAVEMTVARPGDKTRIIPVKDVIEPRVRLDNEITGYPGVTDKMGRVGAGRTLALKGAAVVTTGDIVAIQEGLIDMWGEGAKYTPFSQTCNLVLTFTPRRNLEAHQHEEAVREAGLKAAEYLGKAAENMEPDNINTYDLPAMNKRGEEVEGLPRVAYLKMLIAQGLLHDSYIYGIDAKETLPTWIHPNEILDGALVSGNCVAACDKITTYQHQNNSIILDLYDRHGKDLNFLGVVLTPELTTFTGKVRACEHATGLIKTMGADGVIISEEGYGNPDSDLLQNCKLLEEDGIKTVLITDECAGNDGFSQSLADTSSVAKAVISTGNVSHMVKLDPAERVIGNIGSLANLAGGSGDSFCDDGSIVCELNAIIGSTSEIGYHNLTARQY